MKSTNVFQEEAKAKAEAEKTKAEAEKAEKAKKDVSDLELHCDKYDHTDFSRTPRPRLKPTN